VHSPTRTPAQTSPLFQTSGSRSPALRRGGLELDHVFRPSRGPKIKWRPYKLRKQFSARAMGAGWMVDHGHDAWRHRRMRERLRHDRQRRQPDWSIAPRSRSRLLHGLSAALDGDWIDVGGGACCREMFAIKRRQTVGEAGQVASINLFHYRRGVWPTSQGARSAAPQGAAHRSGWERAPIWFS